MVFIGNKKVENIRIRLIDYDKAKIKEDELKSVSDGSEFIATNTVTWINVDGLHEQPGDVFEPVRERIKEAKREN